MITSYKQLTGRYLKANKKRTILTIVGIVLSVALICTMGLFIKGMQAAQLEKVKNGYGSFHIMFREADEELFSKVVNNTKVNRYGYYNVSEEVKLEGDLLADKVEATDKALELLPVKLKEGKMPEGENEVALEEWTLDYLNENVKVGDKIKFNGKEYNLVGILANSTKSQIEHKGILLTKNNNISKEKSMLLVEISSKTNIRTAIDELSKLGEKDKVVENTPVLMMLGAASEGSGMEGLYLVLSVIVGIVVISTIAVIYNSFQISVVERIKEFGLLRAVGTTPKQIRNIVLREATIIAAIGIPLGLLFGVIAMYLISVIFKLIGGDSVFATKVVIDPTVMIISLVVGVVSIYLSALIPAFFAGRISPLVAISSRTSITKEKIKKRNHKFIQKIFGFEGAMAAKNIKRNRKRYRVTVFSIVISVVLFIAFKSFMDMALTVTDVPNESRDIHFQVYKNEESKNGNPGEFNNLAESIKEISTVDKVYKAYGGYSFDSVINKSSVIKEAENFGSIYNNINLNGTEKILLHSSMVIYDKNALEASKKYLESGSIDIDKINQENGVILIKKNVYYDESIRKTYSGQIADVKVGDEIELQYKNEKTANVEFSKGNIVKVKIMAIVEDNPFDFYGNEGGLKLITTEDTFKKITEESNVRPSSLLIKLVDVKDEEVAKGEIQNKIGKGKGYNIINNIDSNKKAKSTMLMVQILIYGFVIVVSLIGCVNIINTLTTNIILRKKEFAALKSIGLTQKGLRKMIILEGILYAVMGTIYGSVIGCGLSYLMYLGLWDIRLFPWDIPWNSIAIAGISALIIGYLAVLSPLSRIKKENVIEALREE
ncbi:MAG: ABC transporter permease [Clostridiaceae bacterium]